MFCLRRFSGAATAARAEAVADVTDAVGHAPPALDYWSMLFVFVLATFVGLGVIRRVSRLLYTPLMSLTNAISAIAVVGSIIVTGSDYPAHSPAGGRGPGRLDDQYRQRIHDHGPHAEDVQAESIGRRRLEMIHSVVQLAYVVATVLFVLSLHWMSDPKTAPLAVTAGILGMALAVLATWVEVAAVNGQLGHHLWIMAAIAVGFVVGVPLSRVPLTAVPQRTALSHAFGGLATGLVGTAEYFLWLSEGPEKFTPFRTAALVAEVILGFVTLSGSLMAAGKLQEVKWIPQRPVTYPLQNFGNIGVLVLAVGLGVALVFFPTGSWSGAAFLLIVALALAFGVLLIIPIGGADMPTVISILNSYAGLSAVAMGFVLDNKLLITAGALDGSSGLILSIIMCRAMNRSFTNVLFGAFGQVQAAIATGEQKAYKSESVEGAAADSGNGPARGHRARLWHGRGPGASQGARALRPVEEARRDRQVRHTSGRGPHAGSHECALGRGRDSLHRPGRDG